MGQKEIRRLFEAVKTGELSPDDAAKRLAPEKFKDLGFAKVDIGRGARQGFPEVIFCQGKKPAQAAKIAQELAKRGENVLATRASPEVYAAMAAVLPKAVYYEDAKVITVHNREVPRLGGVAICTAGTADIPVAEEAALTASEYGCDIKRIYDVGVAGIHRLFSRLDEIRACNVVIAVAGMEGALASVLGGLIDKPLIAVPTSVGYGANFGGLSALLTMINSCASGVTVVNINNGFGAAVAAAKINRLLARKAENSRSGRKDT